MCPYDLGLTATPSSRKWMPCSAATEVKESSAEVPLKLTMKLSTSSWEKALPEWVNRCKLDRTLGKRAACQWKRSGGRIS